MSHQLHCSCPGAVHIASKPCPKSENARGSQGKSEEVTRSQHQRHRMSVCRASASPISISPSHRSSPAVQALASASATAGAARYRCSECGRSPLSTCTSRTLAQWLRALPPQVRTSCSSRTSIYAPTLGGRPSIPKSGSGISARTDRRPQRRPHRQQQVQPQVGVLSHVLERHQPADRVRHEHAGVLDDGRCHPRVHRTLGFAVHQVTAPSRTTISHRNSSQHVARSMYRCSVPVRRALTPMNQTGASAKIRRALSGSTHVERSGRAAAAAGGAAVRGRPRPPPRRPRCPAGGRATDGPGRSRCWAAGSPSRPAR